MLKLKLYQVNDVSEFLDLGPRPCHLFQDYHYGTGAAFPFRSGVKGQNLGDLAQPMGGKAFDERLLLLHLSFAVDDEYAAVFLFFGKGYEAHDSFVGLFHGQTVQIYKIGFTVFAVFQLANDIGLNTGTPKLQHLLRTYHVYEGLGCAFGELFG